MSKDAEEDDLCDAVLALASGRTVVAPDLQHEVFQHVRQARLQQREEPALVPSARELEVLRALAQGLGSAEIAKAMHLGTGTVKTYQARVYEKLGVSGATAAVAEALRRGLIE
ncbi:response regulator transcription factor [Conexibacter sp. W3-3-2]|uniref:helix-turn-helix transcriptional regulator n=1 Tax=Conexibacter sp. W3-3-2 TaxID=2675227 RepID=UPI001E4D0FBF|nr:response regulator transcription factor [Conexibacter sp. W3-3-2]